MLLLAEASLVACSNGTNEPAKDEEAAGGNDEFASEAVNKINFNNFFADNLQSVSGTHKVHPALSK